MGKKTKCCSHITARKSYRSCLWGDHKVKVRDEAGHVAMVCHPIPSHPLVGQKQDKAGSIREVAAVSRASTHA